MKQGVFGFSIIMLVSFLRISNASFSGYESRGPVFLLGPVVGFSFAKTPKEREKDSGKICYDKIGHSLGAGVIGNVFYKISKERLVGLQCCISRFKLKDFYSINPITTTENENAESVEEGETSGEMADPSAYDGEDSVNGDLVKNGSLRYMDLLVMFKYNLTWARTAISFGGGVSKCAFSPSREAMKTNLGYVVHGAVEYQVNKNITFSTSVRLRHHAKKEQFDEKKNSSINNFNVETGILFSL